jgi:hypothetical protein
VACELQKSCPAHRYVFAINSVDPQILMLFSRHSCVFGAFVNLGCSDPMVLMTALPGVKISAVAKHSLFSAPLVSFFLKECEAIPVAQPYDVGKPPDQQVCQHVVVVLLENMRASCLTPACYSRHVIMPRNLHNAC